MSRPYFIESTPKSYIHPSSGCEQFNLTINASRINTINKADISTGVWAISFTVAGTTAAWGYTSEESRNADYEQIMNRYA